MEESIDSSLSSSRCCSEESGWTTYLEDFMAAEEKSQVASCSSTIWDAASASTRAVDVAVSTECRKLRLTWEKDDDSLQDTASSSFNSSKAAEIDHTTTKVMNDQELKEVEDGFNFIDGTDGPKNACLVPCQYITSRRTDH
ncbi:vascular-related unknown protein 1-like [Zingiber officinale]|uniref:vascular-related unknown protein 1-like n=1 Tax=Zingiber officinale TaxID=94328 RepID=UPI001C4AFCF2|nr:vascular-related unknown protein 1-like [Zingiber officinale]